MVDFLTFPLNPGTREGANWRHDQVSKTSSGHGSVSASDENNERAFASNDSLASNGFQGAQSVRQRGMQLTADDVRTDPQPRSRPLSEALALHGLDLDARLRSESNVEASATKDFAYRPLRETAIHMSEVGRKVPDLTHENIVNERFHKTSDSGSALNALTVTTDKRKSTEKFISTAQITKKLKKATIRSPHSHRKFLPESQLAKIITDDAVRNELFKPIYSITNLWKKNRAQVLPGQNVSYQKIFAILCLMKRTCKLKFFVECAVCDSHLPLDKVPPSDNSGNYPGLRSRRDSEAPTVKLRRDDDIDEFFERQWSVLAPSFDGSDRTQIPHSDLEPETILPFLNPTDAVNEGGFSKVFKAEIHPDHHSLSKPGVCALL
jgi:hypothetical protein